MTWNGNLKIIPFSFLISPPSLSYLSFFLFRQRPRKETSPVEIFHLSHIYFYPPLPGQTGLRARQPGPGYRQPGPNSQPDRAKFKQAMPEGEPARCDELWMDGYLIFPFHILGSTGLCPLSGPLPCFLPRHNIKSSLENIRKAGQGNRWRFHSFFHSFFTSFFLSFFLSFFRSFFLSFFLSLSFFFCFVISWYTSFFLSFFLSWERWEK